MSQYSHSGYARELSKALPFDLVVTQVNCGCCGEEYALWRRPKGSKEDEDDDTLMIYLQEETPECLDRAARVLLREYEAAATGPYPSEGEGNHEARTDGTIAPASTQRARLIRPE